MDKKQKAANTIKKHGEGRPTAGSRCLRTRSP